LDAAKTSGPLHAYFVRVPLDRRGGRGSEDHSTVGEGRGRIASPRMLLDNFPPMIGTAPPNRLGSAHGGNDQYGRAARGFVGGGGAYWSAGRVEKGRILDALCQTTGWHRKHAVRALRRRVVDKAVENPVPRVRKRRYGATIKDALTALWQASDRVCGKRLVASSTRTWR
jgi:hypothetical protein